ncbi:hypothetical protein LCGC14_3123690, partial [marine sediment metagenome]
RLGVPLMELESVDTSYQEFNVPKRSGGTRRIAAPNPKLKALQRRINRRLLGRLGVHPCATGFRGGCSIVTNAVGHAGRAVVLKMDIEDFFGSTAAKRVEKYFRAIGWAKDAARGLTRLTTHDGALPQGAPTSPTLSNLLNYQLDARLVGVAGAVMTSDRQPASVPPGGVGIFYTRYADDLTFSFDADEHDAVEAVIWLTKRIVADYGYRLHQKRKLTIRRRHQSQRVTGLVVNHRPALPRKTRRWLRAVRHHVATGREASLTAQQLAGWDALEHMIQAQSGTQ